MKINNFSKALIILSCFAAFSSLATAQDKSVVKGLTGGGITAVEVSVNEMLMKLGPDPLQTREVPEGEPPYVTPHPAPMSADLNNITIDKPSNYNMQTAPVLGTGFEGITQGGYIPSEPTAAVGPTQVFSPGNVSVTITNKDGSGRTEINGASFFGVPTSEGAISDAVCCYDAIRGRFVALCFTQGSGTSKYSNFYLMVSKTSDARGSWWQYKLDWRVDGSTITKNWGDYEEFGFSGDKFVISSQQFSFAGNSYKYQKLRVMDITKVYGGAALTWVDFVNFPAPPGGSVSNLFVTKPGRNLTAGDNTIHVFTTRYNGGTNVAYRYISGTPASPSLSAGTLITVNSYGAAVNAKGGSNTATVVCNDCRTQNFVVRGGYLHTAWHFGINFGSGTVDAVRYLKINVSTPSTPVKVTDETFGANGIFYYYPSCTADQYGNMFIGFGRSSQTEYPSSYVSGKRTTDASIEASVLAKSGAAVTSQSRWGDYTGIDMDEVSSGPTVSVAWYAGQWSKSGNAFGTWLSQISFASPTASPLVKIIENNSNSSVKPERFDVKQNYPNPSNPSSVIEYQLPSDSKVTIKVYDMLGNEVATLVDKAQTAGIYSAVFDGTSFASGVYFYRVSASSGNETFNKTYRMIILK